MSWRPSTCASTLAISVLPTPASPSRNNGRPMRNARNTAVASDRSATYSPFASNPSVASMESGSAELFAKCLLHGALRHDGDQMAAILGGGMDIRIQIGRRHFDSPHRIGREGFAQGLFHVGDAKYARARTGGGDAHAAGTLGDEHADHRVARGRILEFHVAGALRDRNGQSRINLAWLGRGSVH